MARDIGFAVIGLGMGMHHCRAIKDAPGARLVAVCDLDEERLQLAAEEYDCKSYSNFHDLLEDDQVEVVNIATPSGKHAEIGIPVAAAGKHIIVEKPADISTARIDELMAAGQRNKVRIAGVFQARFKPLNKRIRQVIKEGRMGHLIGVHGHLPWYRLQSYFEGRHGTWKGTWEMDGGGSLMNQGIHTMDLLQWFGGPVEAVMGMFGVFGHRIEAEDQTVALLRFKSGALGTLYTTTCCYPGFDQRITLFGTEGSIIKEEGELISWKLQDDSEGREEEELMRLYGSEKNSGEAVDPMAVSFDGHTQIVGDMVEAILQDRAPVIGLDSARHAVEIINAVYEAARSGKEVKVGDS